MLAYPYIGPVCGT